MIETAKFALHWTIIACYLAAGIMDLTGRHWKPGVLAIGFGILNMIIFVWRPKIGG